MTWRLIVVIAAVTALAGCSSSSGGTSAQSSNPAPSRTIAPTPTTPPPPPWTRKLARKPYHPKVTPANFTDHITNRYFPLPKGTTFIFEGTRDGVPRRDEVAVTKGSKTILGVPCVVVSDIVTSSGALVEKTTDWYAQDTSGNVWYFGEDTKEYVNGAVSSTAGTWEAGVDGALPGIVMPAAPKSGSAYRQEYRPGVAEDVAKILRTDGTQKIPAGHYRNVVVTEDRDPLDLTKLEHKFYAPGVGFVGSAGVVNGHHEVTRLTSILRKA